ncbi:uncharacterized protein LOC141705765 isoform X2 [Apium graveolens]
MKEIEESTCRTETNAFNFYDHGEMMKLTKKTTHLADVIGIVKFYQPLTHLVNRFNDAQKQVKLILTDGRSSINVTFWDTFAEIFDEQMKEVREKTTILIIKSSRVGLWNDQVDLSSVGGLNVISTTIITVSCS